MVTLFVHQNIVRENQENRAKLQEGGKAGGCTFYQSFSEDAQ
jgi:hypothetical protein